MADLGDATASLGDEIKPYRIHVSSKYLDLTRQKLELTRLPHEGSAPKSQDWWEPKPQVEPLIDYWLEKYSWRAQEDAFNDSLAQFRTSIEIPSSETPLRVHFVHVRSDHANAVPLLLIPPFPFTNLSLGPLLEAFDAQEDTTADQPFHLVVPALPGLGFSDPLPNNTPVVSTVAQMLNTLMSRLGYEYYLASNTGAAASSPAEIDWKVVNWLATRYASSCLGTHLISPPLTAPSIRDAPWEWTKWSIANFFHAGILGYSHDDFAALERHNNWHSGVTSSTTKEPATTDQAGLNRLGLREPNTLAYALCDSPTGLLVFVMKGLRMLSPTTSFTHEQVITFTELAWLPGPEYAMRFWAHCAAHDEEREAQRERLKARKSAPAVRPRVAITVFLGGKNATAETSEPPTDSGGIAQVAGGAEVAEGAVVADGADGVEMDVLPAPVPRVETDKYVCPAWANAHFEVVHSQRVAGKPGLLAWEHPDAILAGVTGLAKAILKLDKRLAAGQAEGETVPLQQIVVHPADDDTNGGGGTTAIPGEDPPHAATDRSAAEASEAVNPPSRPPLTTTESPALSTALLAPILEHDQSQETVVATPSPGEKAEKEAKILGDLGSDKGKTLEVPHSPFFEGESPDTLVGKTPPLES